MVWYDKKSMCSVHFQRPRRRRCGSLLIEAAIAVALLATAAYGLSQLASGSAALARQADQRLAATLAAENTRQRLRRISDENLAEKSGEIAALVTNASGCEVTVSIEPFANTNHEGVHIRIDVSPEESIRVSLHDWRLTTGPSPSDETSDPADPEPVPSESEVNDA